MCAKWNKKSVVFVVLTVISLALVIVSVVLILKIIPDVIHDQVDKNTRLENGTEQFDRFVELPFPIKFKAFIFNISNADDILNGEIPKLSEIGPYVYDQFRKKDNFTINDEDDTISYTQMETFTFNAGDSGTVTENDKIIILNAPFMSALQNGGPALESGISKCFPSTYPGGSTTMFIETTVREFLFEGIEFCFENQTKSQCGVACTRAESFTNVDKITRYCPKDKTNTDTGNCTSDDTVNCTSCGYLKFSLFNFKRRDNDGVYTVKRGLEDISTLGHITKLNDKTHDTNHWNKVSSNEENSCNEVKGSDSTIYPPRVEQDDFFAIYSTDICRYINIFYEGEGSYAGLDGYKFAVNTKTLRPSTENIQEDCFCTTQTKDVNGNQTCFLDGTLDLQSCLGAPVLLSFPHFLWADKHYTDQYEPGTFKPNESIHETYLLVEPNTGTPLQGVKRIQISAVLRPFPKATGVPTEIQNLPRVVLPLVWVEEGVSLTDKYVEQLRTMYFDKVQIADIVKWTLLGVSSAAALIFGALFLKYFLFQ